MTIEIIEIITPKIVLTDNLTIWTKMFSILLINPKISNTYRKRIS